MRYYYDAEFTHIIDHHQDDIMDNIKKKYTDDVFDLIESFLYGYISEHEFIKTLKDYIIASAELVYEKHHAR
jgi:hypothetical protein